MDVRRDIKWVQDAKIDISSFLLVGNWGVLHVKIYFFIPLFPLFYHIWKGWRRYPCLAEFVIVIGLYGVYQFGMEVRVLQGEFCKTVQYSPWDFVEGTECVGTAFSNIFQRFSFLPWYPKLQVPLRRPAHVHVQEWESFVRTCFNIFLPLRGRYVRSICPYFIC